MAHRTLSRFAAATHALTYVHLRLRKGPGVKKASAITTAK